MKSMKIISLCIVLLGATLRMSAQQVELSLKESIRIASDSSLQAFRTKNLYLASYWEHRSFLAGRLPSLNFSATPIRYNRDIVMRYNSEKDIDEYRNQQTLYGYGNLSVQQNLDITGGTFFVDTELGYMRNLGSNAYSQFTSVPIRIGYSQALLGFNGFKWEKKIEPLKYERAKKQYLYNREEISETVIRYFFDLAMAQLEFDMAAENLASSDTLYRIGQERQMIAAISQADLLTLKLDAVNARNSFRNAELSLERAMFSFVSYLNLEESTVVKVRLPDPPQSLTIFTGDALEYAHENHPDFNGYQQEMFEAEREVERTRKSAGFDARFSASIGFNQVSNRFKEVYRHPLEQDIISVSVSIPLVDWGVRKGRANMARNTLNVLKISTRQKELSLEQDVIMTVNDFNKQQDLLGSSEEAVRLATMAYQSTRERFIIGKADLNSLTLSLSRQNTAQRNYISSLRDYWSSYYRLRKLTLFDFDRQEILTEQFDRIERIAY